MRPPGPQRRCLPGLQASHGLQSSPPTLTPSEVLTGTLTVPWDRGRGSQVPEEAEQKGSTGSRLRSGSLPSSRSTHHGWKRELAPISLPESLTPSPVSVFASRSSREGGADTSGPAGNVASAQSEHG